MDADQGAGNGEGSLLQKLGVVPDVFAGKRGDKVVAMIIAVVQPDGDVVKAFFVGNGFKVFREKLALLVKVICGSGIDEDVRLDVGRFQKESCIVLGAIVKAVFEVAVESLFAPGTLGGVADGREG